MILGGDKMAILEGIYNYLLFPALLCMLLVAGGICTIRLGRYLLGHPLQICKDLIMPGSGGGWLSSAKSLSVALAGTLGVGNIVGVASAIISGGAGAVFWMWAGALLTMAVKYAEVVLAVRYRKPSDRGFIGGAMYYLRSPRRARWFALLCLFASFTLGNIMQARTAALAVTAALPIPPLLCGGILALILGLVICKGFARISRVTLCMVPLMSGVYIFLCIWAISKQFSALPAVLADIFRSAFTPSALLGGTGGLALARVIRAGIARGLITHEAGCGTAPIAHAEAETDSPPRQGFFGIFEVFADTMILCSLTAFVLLLYGRSHPLQEDMTAVNGAFGVAVGNTAPALLAILTFVFALATMLGWSHYGNRCLDYLLKGKPHRQTIKKLYALAYSLMAILGSVTDAGLMWLLADCAVAWMAILHLPDLLARLSEVAEESRYYFQSARSLDRTFAPDADKAKSKDLREIPGTTNAVSPSSVYNTSISSK